MLAILLQCSRCIECDSVNYNITPSNLECLGPHCLTFQQFSANASKFLKNDTSLRFSSGVHYSPSDGLNIANKERFSTNSENMDSVITCNESRVFIFENVAKVNLTNLIFKGCGKINPKLIAVIKVINSNIHINHCTFIHSKGMVIDTKLCTLTVTGSIFRFSNGSALVVRHYATVFITNSIYEWNNSSQLPMIYVNLGKASLKHCLFRKNSPKGSVRMIYIRNSTVELRQCKLDSNRATANILLSANSIVSISETIFKQNFISSSGIVLLDNCLSTIFNSMFLRNTATISRILLVYKSKIKIYGKFIFQENIAEQQVFDIDHSEILSISNEDVKNHGELIIQGNIASWGVFAIRHSVVQMHQTILIQGNSGDLHTVAFGKSTIKFNGDVSFINNTGCILIEESQMEFTKSNKFSGNERENSIIYEYGGAITSIWSTIKFNGTTRFLRNKSWKVGGAIFAIESRLYANNAIQFSNNFAEEGGALYLDNSNFMCEKECMFNDNMATLRGGAIHAINSLIYIGYEWHTPYHIPSSKQIKISIVNNTAQGEGGGLSLGVNAKLQGPLDPLYDYIINFTNNTANKGAAIYVDDSTYTGTCNNNQYSTCFFNIPYYFSRFSREMQGKISIHSNSGKFTLYGGLLDRCIQGTSFIEILHRQYTKIGIDSLKNISNNPDIEQMITSDPVRICFCDGETEYNCIVKSMEYESKNGEPFTATIVAVDQVERSVNATIIVEYQSAHIRLGTGQRIRNISDRCSNVTLTAYTSQQSISTNLTIYAKGPCKGIGISSRTLIVHILPCECPIGFEPSPKSESCSCDCSLRLKSYKVLCNQTSKSIIRQDDFWINYTQFNDSGTIKVYYVVYSHCPYDYCLLPTSNVSINLNIPNGIDAQCVDSRTGLLCSTCKSDLSLSLGSSLCLRCLKNWPTIFVIIILGAMTSGVVLVIAIFILDLTVAIGTLNGLIFYANVVASNHYSLPKSSFFSVFISWLNLELGLDTCFYKGMDSYSKAWLQFVYPTYLIVLLVMVIIMSKYSSKFAKLIGKRNPIATLATLMLLSYTKIIRNIIDIFSVAVIHYHDHHKILWLPDANIRYLHGKHIPLFFFATIIIAMGLAYTLLLFTWQWLLKAPNHKLLKWTRNTRLNLFMEANLAAHTPKHRYWTGLLLLIRVALYIEIAYHNSYETNASILATGLIAGCLLFVKALYRNKVYKKRVVDYLDSFSYLNLLVLSTAQLYNQNNMTAAKLSVSAAFLQFLFVLTYHTIKIMLQVPCLKRLNMNSSLAQRLYKKESKPGESVLTTSQEITMQEMAIHVTPTSSEVGLSDSKEEPTPECGDSEKYDISDSGRALQSFITKWDETDGLREPLLQES
jgi:predicted outer membrane repeat protein